MKLCHQILTGNQAPTDQLHRSAASAVAICRTLVQRLQRLLIGQQLDSSALRYRLTREDSDYSETVAGKADV
jgi:hypothetical protein